LRILQIFEKVEKLTETINDTIARDDDIRNADVHKGWLSYEGMYIKMIEKWS